MKQNLLISMTFVVAGCLGFTAGRMSSSDLVTSPELPASQPSSLSVAAEQSLKFVRHEPVIGIASLTSDTSVRAVRECGSIPAVLPNTDGVQWHPEKLSGENRLQKKLIQTFVKASMKDKE